ncbi:choice-of-anchor W domain-containing protein [Natronomonas sp.]|uniref:choice-of-anchor W domain-containing protein n=1 Tax=Natronomonas sp. TaxID=2184060 RepID=UPI002FC30D43
MTDDNNQIGLSRRKMLGGLGAIGLASAGAGLGTTAYFNDEENFVGNTLTAGELDLFVHVDYSEDQGDYAQYQTPPGTFVDGNVVGGGEGEPLSIEVDDLKPGDSGFGKLCFSIVDNPAYMWMCGELTANDENGQTEPEAAVDATGGDPGEGAGELADAMVAGLAYCYEEDVDGETDLVVSDDIVSGSLRDVLLALRNGVPLDGSGDPDAGIERDPFEGVDQPFVDDDINAAETCLCIHWEVPTEVGNEIQTDSVAFDLSFYAEQARHNDGLTNPCVTSREGESFAKGEAELAEPSWHARGIYGDGGGAANRELDIRLPDDTPVHSGTENYAWPNGQAVPFSLTIDGGDAKWNVDGSEVTVANAPIPVANGIGVTAKSRTADASIAVEDVRVNGSVPSGPDSVTAAGSSETNYIMLEGATLQEGDVVSGMVTMAWTSTPAREGLGFRIDV